MIKQHYIDHGIAGWNASFVIGVDELCYPLQRLYKAWRPKGFLNLKS